MGSGAGEKKGMRILPRVLKGGCRGGFRPGPARRSGAERVSAPRPCCFQRAAPGPRPATAAAAAAAAAAGSAAEGSAASGQPSRLDDHRLLQQRAHGVAGLGAHCGSRGRTASGQAARQQRCQQRGGRGRLRAQLQHAFKRGFVGPAARTRQPLLDGGGVEVGLLLRQAEQAAGAAGVRPAATCMHHRHAAPWPAAAAPHPRRGPAVHAALARGGGGAVGPAAPLCCTVRPPSRQAAATNLERVVPAAVGRQCNQQSTHAGGGQHPQLPSAASPAGSAAAPHSPLPARRQSSRRAQLTSPGTRGGRRLAARASPPPRYGRRAASCGPCA